ncbi:hypothetical protein FV222_02200 [Methylobacterium sp. WL103]|uniref:hypothetical protein n=1 Tax=Methylobacterium sp. WL103 TaxID=2603891 RepID=UPI0011C99F3A|nr:hypothetical protein [Methylobacterium sp. WL103]TXN07496.1 hypothetical protein FV222_02200 [Methylobacterium sp. WL103]
MTIEPTEFDMVALARRGLQALLDEAVAEVEFAQRYAIVDTGLWSPTPEAIEAKEQALNNWSTADERLRRFNALYPEPVAR